VGQTTQHLCKRVKQHLTRRDSKIYQHIQITKHQITSTNVTILDRQDNREALTISEANFIQKYRPLMNAQTQLKLLLEI